MSNVDRNKAVRVRNGNGKGKGKAKNAIPTPQIDAEEMRRQEVQAALPEAAYQRAIPELFSEDWSVPTRSVYELSAAPGVALVGKQHIPMALRQVGYSRNPVGILTTPRASQLHLKGYPCQEPRVRVTILDDNAEHKEVYVKRYLVQLGFGGARVEPSSLGQEVTLMQTMSKIVLKLPLFCGCLPEHLKSNTNNGFTYAACQRAHHRGFADSRAQQCHVLSA